MNGWDATGKNEEEDVEIDEDVDLVAVPVLKTLTGAIVRCFIGIAMTVGFANFHAWPAYVTAPVTVWACLAALGVPGFGW